MRPGTNVCRVRERRKSRRVALTIDVTHYFSVHSAMFEHRHSHIVVDDGIQTYVKKNTAYDDKQIN